MTIEATIQHIEQSISKALHGESKLDAATLAVHGFPTPTMRRFFNNICADPVRTYLECGAFFGASACAAMCGNKELTSYIVEDFSQDFSQQNVRAGLLANLEAARPKTGKLNFIEANCFKMDLKRITLPIDVFFFDGKHEFEFQAKALPHFLDKMADVFIFVVDDFQWEEVRRGTLESLDALNGKVVIRKHLDLVGDKKQDDPVWHNGVGIWVISKV